MFPFRMVSVHPIVEENAPPLPVDGQSFAHHWFPHWFSKVFEKSPVYWFILFWCFA